MITHTPWLRLLPLIILLLQAATPLLPSAHAAEDAKAMGERLIKESDQKLDHVYRQLKARLTKDHATELEKAQAAWRAYRSADARVQAILTSGGGSAYTTDYMSHLITATEERTQKLDHMLKQAKDHYVPPTKP